MPFKINQAVLLILVFAAGLLSCNNSGNTIEELKEKKAEIIEEKKIELKIDPFHLKLWNWKKDFNETSLAELRKEYNGFFDLYCTRIINVGKPNDPKFSFYLSQFLKDPSVTEIYEACIKQNKDFLKIENELSEAFTIYSHYFPNKKTPTVKTFVSGFNYGIIVNENSLGIGLDMFLGKNHSFYKMVGVPEYLSYFMRQDIIVSEAVKGWVESEFINQNEPNQTLLNEMINAGKVLYLADVILPETADSIKIKYAAQQMLWIQDNEVKCWQYLIDQKALFKTDYMEKRKYLNDAPFTSNLPRESPPRIGQYFGWQIVRAFMNNNPDLTPDKLLLIKDAQLILTKSKYKPIKKNNS
jgi:hypothetical protein